MIFGRATQNDYCSGEAENVAKRKKNQVLDTVITVSQNEIEQNYII